MPKIYVHRIEDRLHKTERQYSPSTIEQFTNMTPVGFAQYPEELVFRDIALISASHIPNSCPVEIMKSDSNLCQENSTQNTSLVNEWRNNYYILSRYAKLTIYWTPC